MQHLGGRPLTHPGMASSPAKNKVSHQGCCAGTTGRDRYCKHLGNQSIESRLALTPRKPALLSPYLIPEHTPATFGRLIWNTARDGGRAFTIVREAGGQHGRQTASESCIRCF